MKIIGKPFNGIMQGTLKKDNNRGSSTFFSTFPTTAVYSWIVPPRVTSISAVVVGGGGAGNRGGLYNAGGGGGGLRYMNNFPVTPGETLTIQVGGPLSSSQPASLVNGVPSYIARGPTVLIQGNGGSSAPISAFPGGNGGLGSISPVVTSTPGTTSGGGNGGAGGLGTASEAGGGGGAGGYSGNGGKGQDAPPAAAPVVGAAGTGGAAGGGNRSLAYAGGGGGVNCLIGGASGPANSPGSNLGGKGAPLTPLTPSSHLPIISYGITNIYGGLDGRPGVAPTPSAFFSMGGAWGGGGGGSDNPVPSGNSRGGDGIVRIIFPGVTRQFPSTNTLEINYTGWRTVSFPSKDTSDKRLKKNIKYF